MPDENPNDIQNMSEGQITENIANLPGSLLAFDDPDEGAESEPQPQQNPPQEAVDNAEDEPGEADEGDEEEADEAEDDEDTESETEDETEAEDAEEGDPVFEVLNPQGEAQEVKLSELAEAYTQIATIQKTKAETAERQRRLEEREAELPRLIAEKTREREDQLAQTIHQWSERQQLIEPPNPDLLDINSPEYDPETYQAQQARYQRQQADFERAGRAIKDIAERRHREQQEAFQAETQKLVEAWPEIKDANVRNEVYTFLADGYGLGREEVDGVQDHRLFLLAKDAMEGRRTKAELPKIRQKVKARALPKPVRSGGRDAASSAKQSSVAKKQKRLRNTGRPEDAIDLMMDIIS